VCDEQSGGRPGLTRRRLLQGMVAVAALAGCDDRTTPRSAAAASATPLPTRPPNGEGLAAYVLAMHVHASASEGQGSMHAQLLQAAATGFDVLWFTEHDWRRRRLLFRPVYSFVPGEAYYGGVWRLDRETDEGDLAPGSGGGQVDDPVSPFDPATRKASLRLDATSAGSDPATVRFRVHAEGTSRANFRSRIAGRTISVDHLPETTGPLGWGEVLFELSRHPAAANRPEGVLEVLYRLRTDVDRATTSTEGTRAIVDLPVAAGRWQNVTFDLLGDLHRVWPDLDPRDNSLHDIEFRATSSGRAPARVFFGHLRFEEQAGYDAVGVEHDLVARYASTVTDVLGLVGTEISLGPHLNQFGGPQAPYDYGPIDSLRDVPGRDIIPSVVDFVHRQGGLASVNHPAGSSQSVARSLLAMQAGGADLLEVGYSHGGLGSFPGHLAAWDALSRNGLFVTGNGVSDDHSGQDWAGQPNRFYTAAWSARRDEKTLMGALARGRAYVGYLGSFGGTIDMSVDAAPMGSVLIGTEASRTLRIDVTGLPDGAGVQVLRGAVDYAGVADPNPSTTVVRTLGGSDLARASTLTVDAGGECFHRLQVVDRRGQVIAFGQPTWTLSKPPPTGIPAARRA
jgi:hypothetical protein